MGIRKEVHYIIIALGAAVFSGCSKELDEKGGKEPGKGGNASLTINIETKRPTPFDGEAADGGAINDAYIFVVKDDDNVIDGIATVTANESTSESVTIENLDFGAHKIYVYANTEGFDNIYPAFKTTVKNLTKGDVFNYAEAQFENLASGALPQIANGEMPLTGLVKDIVLGAGSNSANIELVRPFAKLTIKVYNESKYRERVEIPRRCLRAVFQCVQPQHGIRVRPPSLCKRVRRTVYAFAHIFGSYGIFRICDRSG